MFENQVCVCQKNAGKRTVANLEMGQTSDGAKAITQMESRSGLPLGNGDGQQKTERYLRS